MNFVQHKGTMRFIGLIHLPKSDQLPSTWQQINKMLIRPESCPIVRCYPFLYCRSQYFCPMVRGGDKATDLTPALEAYVEGFRSLFNRAWIEILGRRDSRYGSYIANTVTNWSLYVEIQAQLWDLTLHGHIYPASWLTWDEL